MAPAPLTVGLLELFEGPLRDVRFPDADAQRLRAAVTVAEEAELAVVAAELALEAARTELQERQECVTKETSRALAYVRVYASDRPELCAALDALSAKRADRTARRGRPRKAAVALTTPAEGAEDLPAAAE